MSLFAARGIAASRSADVARAAGVAHGTVFLHFPTQEELVTAVIEEFGDGMCRSLHGLCERGEGLRELLGAHLRAVEEREDFYARLVTEASVLVEAAAVTLVAIQSTVSFHILKAAEADMAAGKIRRMAPHLLFNTWIGLVHHYIANRGLFAPGGSVLRRRGTEILEHFLFLVEGGPR